MLLVSAMMYFVWFPPPFIYLLGGIKLLALVMGCDLVLGPLLTFVVSKPGKRYALLVLDYTVIVCVQQIGRASCRERV